MDLVGDVGRARGSGSSRPARSAAGHLAGRDERRLRLGVAVAVGVGVAASRAPPASGGGVAWPSPARRRSSWSPAPRARAARSRRRPRSRRRWRGISRRWARGHRRTNLACRPVLVARRSRRRSARARLGLGPAGAGVGQRARSRRRRRASRSASPPSSTTSAGPTPTWRRCSATTAGRELLRAPARWPTSRSGAAPRAGCSPRRATRRCSSRCTGRRSTSATSTPTPSRRDVAAAIREYLAGQRELQAELAAGLGSRRGRPQPPADPLRSTRSRSRSATGGDVVADVPAADGDSAARPARRRRRQRCGRAEADVRDDHAVPPGAHGALRRRSLAVRGRRGRRRLRGRRLGAFTDVARSAPRSRPPVGAAALGAQPRLIPRRPQRSGPPLGSPGGLNGAWHRPGGPARLGEPERLAGAPGLEGGVRARRGGGRARARPRGGRPPSAVSEAGTSTRLSGSTRYGAAARSPNSTTLSVPGSAALGTIAPGTPAARSRSASRWHARRSSETRSPGRSPCSRRLGEPDPRQPGERRPAAPRCGGAPARAARRVRRPGARAGTRPTARADAGRGTASATPRSRGGSARRPGSARSAAAAARTRAGTRDRAPHANAVLRVEPAASSELGQPDRVAEQLARRRAAQLGPRPVEPREHAGRRERVAQLAGDPRERPQRGAPPRPRAASARAAEIQRWKRRRSTPSSAARSRCGTSTVAASQRASSFGVRASPTSSASPSAASAWLSRSSAIRSASRSLVVGRRPARRAPRGGRAARGRGRPRSSGRAAWRAPRPRAPRHRRAHVRAARRARRRAGR